MPTSPQVEAVVEAITSHLVSGFNPEKIVPDVENFMADLHRVPEALSDALKKVAAKFESELPVRAEVADAVREMIPGADAMTEHAAEANTVFRNLHEQELRQHHEPRPGENAWNKD